MQNLVNKERDKWIKPWERESFDDLYNKDERFFAILTKGVLSWLNSNLKMYNKPIRHFILNTGSSYLYLENNGYENTWCETTGENFMYMETPRCIVSLGNFSVPQEELTAPTSRGIYERQTSKNQIMSFNSLIQRLPIELTMSLKYTFSTFNEAIIFVQELFETMLFQKYFNIIYLGQVIECSIELDGNTQIALNQLDLSSNEPNRRIMEFDIKICSNLPIISIPDEAESKNVIVTSELEIKTFSDEQLNNVQY